MNKLPVLLIFLLIAACGFTSENVDKGISYTYQVVSGSISRASLVFKVNFGDGEERLPYVTKQIWTSDSYENVSNPYLNYVFYHSNKTRIVIKILSDGSEVRSATILGEPGTSTSGSLNFYQILDY